MIRLPSFLKDYRLFQVFILGVISGMPFAILYTSLVAWLKDNTIDIAIITTFAVARLPYSLKALWAPVVDYISVPLLSAFGRRKSWMLLTSTIIAAALTMISFFDPSDSISVIRFLAIIIGIMAATYDINCDALRIDILGTLEQGIGAANAVLGYRVGALITGAGALYIADITNNWALTLRMLACVFILGIVFILTVKEARINNAVVGTLKEKIKRLVIAPFYDILSRKGALIICLAIVCYKMGEAMLGFVALPFYMELGYTKEQIAGIVKGFGLCATITGGYVGGLLAYRLGNVKNLIVCGILQAVSNLMYVWLHYQSVENSSLLVAVSIDNFTGGMGSTAIVAYLSSLCNKRYTATQYAILSSMSTFVNSTFSSQSGTLIKMIGWDQFFVMTVLLEIPALLLLLYIGRIGAISSDQKDTPT